MFQLFFQIIILKKITVTAKMPSIFCFSKSFKKDNKGFGDAVMMNLPTAFDIISHGLLIAKLHPYGFDKSALKLLFSLYLNNRWQRTKNFGSSEELLQGVPQGSFLGSLLFNIYLNFLFYLLSLLRFATL